MSLLALQPCVQDTRINSHVRLPGLSRWHAFSCDGKPSVTEQHRKGGGLSEVMPDQALHSKMMQADLIRE